MNFLCIQQVENEEDVVERVFMQMQLLTKCIKRPKQRIEFAKHSVEIKNTLKELINDNNSYLLSSMFVLYAFFSPSSMSKEEMAWKNTLDVIKQLCSSTGYELIYIYYMFLSFYSYENEDNYFPNDMFFYNEHNLSFEKIFNSLIESDHNEIIKKFKKYTNYFKKQYLYEDDDRFLILETVLDVITSYCIINKDYSNYDSYVNQIISSIDKLVVDLEMNNVIDNLGDYGDQMDSTYAINCIEYILNLVMSKEKVRVIR